jgi:hypothetical protein
MAWVNVDLRITYSSGGEWESKSKFIYNEINVPKKILIDIAEKMLENWFILINTKLIKLLEEFDWYHKVTNPTTWAVKYMKGKSDDFIHSFMMLCYFFYEKLNLKFELVKKPTTTTQVGWIQKSEVLKIKYQQHLDKIKKQEQAKNEEQNQLYFTKNVY